jgi:hypothetical protein
MEILNLKKYNTSFFIPVKNGHTLIYTTLSHLFQHFKIEIEFSFDTTTSLDKKIIFTRDPIDRFFSSYFWMKQMIEFDNDHEEKIKINDYLRSSKITDINSYIINYRTFLQFCDDFHYIPQSSQLLFYDNSFFKEEVLDGDLNLLYKNKFKNNFKFIKIESINDVIKSNNNTIIKENIGFNDKLKKTAFNTDTIEFPFLSDFPAEFNFMFMLFYSYFKNLYGQREHHLNINYNDKVTKNEYSKVCQYTSNESYFFGYDQKLISDTEFKQMLI